MKIDPVVRRTQPLATSFDRRRLAMIAMPMARAPVAVITVPLAIISLGLYILGSLGLKFEAIGQVRYAMYLIAPILLAAPLVSKGEASRGSPRASQTLFPMIVYVIAAALSLVSFSMGPLFIRDFTIICSYLLLYSTRYLWRDIEVRVLLFWTVISLLIVYAESGAGFSFNILISASIQDKVDTLESFLGAIFVFYFLRSKRYGLATIALLVCLFGGKRIAMGGLMVGLCFWFATRLPGINRRVSAYTIFIGGLLIASLIGIYFPYIVEFGFRTLPALQGYQIEEFMAGRYFFGMALEDSIYNHRLETIMFGASPGSADAFIVSLGTQVTLSHNDWLKILYDYGYFGYFAFLAIYIKLFGANRDTMALGLATATIMITDNVLIYLFFQIPLFIILSRMTDDMQEVGEPRMAARPSRALLHQRR